MSATINDYKSRNSEDDYKKIFKSPSRIFIDFLVALIFMVMIFSIHQKFYHSLTIGSIIIFILALFYFPSSKINEWCFILTIIASVIIEIVLLMIEKCSSLRIEDTILWAYPLIVGFYLLTITLDYAAFKKK